MTTTIIQAAATFLLAMPVASHMLLQTPPARWSRFNSDYVKAGTVDSDLHAPISGPEGTRLPFPCGRAKGPAGQTLVAGQPAKWSLFGAASHNGGHCEISLSYDDKTFVSIQTILGNCMKNGKLDYEVTIPANAPSGPATFAWTWVNWSGNREYYMNCADVMIQGSPNGVLTGPKIVEANMPGKPTIPEFSSPNTGAELYENRPIVSVTGSGETGPVVPSPTSAKPSNPKPTAENPPVTKPTSEPPVTNPKPTAEPNRPNNSKPNVPNHSKPNRPNHSKPNRPNQPELTGGLSSGKCEHGKWECTGRDYHVCVWGTWQEGSCPPTTKCNQVTPLNILCL